MDTMEDEYYRPSESDPTAVSQPAAEHAASGIAGAVSGAATLHHADESTAMATTTGVSNSNSNSGGDHSKIFVGALSWQTTEESLRVHFGQYGPVQSVEVVRDRHTGGTCVFSSQSGWVVVLLFFFVVGVVYRRVIVCCCFGCCIHMCRKIINDINHVYN
jgi:cobalamin biosynthesis Mg chelatase CobN